MGSNLPFSPDLGTSVCREMLLSLSDFHSLPDRLALKISFLCVNELSSAAAYVSQQKPGLDHPAQSK